MTKDQIDREVQWDSCTKGVDIEWLREALEYATNTTFEGTGKVSMMNTYVLFMSDSQRVDFHKCVMDKARMVSDEMDFLFRENCMMGTALLRRMHTAAMKKAREA